MCRMNFWTCVCLLMIFLCSCISNKSNHHTGENTIGDFSTSFQLEEGWDIYDGGGYRYGPSIMIESDGTLHAWFASPGSIHGLDQMHYNDKAQESPISLDNGQLAAQRFSSDQDFFAVAVGCPGWRSNNSSLTLALYQWKGSYLETIASKSIVSERFENYIDNQNLILSQATKFKAGNYMWVLSSGEGTPGVWAKSGSVPHVTAYLNGELYNGTFRSFLMNNESNGVAYWDQVAYKKSADQGKTWTAEKMVLKPTEGTRDQFSICDPGVVKIGKYYYLGYTSTEDERMIFNHVYVARSESPEGPWQKWDGNNWSTHPQPVITFTGDKDAWGAGEPSMVVKNDSLFFYYTWRDKDKHEIRVATADAKDENWPLKLHDLGVAIDQNNMDNADHGDVKYRDDLNKFVLLHTSSRLSPDSHLVLWESVDGLRFTKVREIKNFAEKYLHNCGWSGDELGHIDPSKPQFLAYGYGPNWGNWNTKWHPIKFDKE